MRKNIILIAVIIIILIGIGLYFFFTSVSKEEVDKKTPGEEASDEEASKELLPVAPPVERYEFQGIDYEIISVGGTIYDIITGQLTEEQVGALAEKIIFDILIQKPTTQEITLLFYSDLIAAGIGEIDVAEISWTPKGTNIKTK